MAGRGGWESGGLCALLSHLVPTPELRNDCSRGASSGLASVGLVSPVDHTLPCVSGLGHSMMDTLAVALRVAEEAIEEAICKAESYGDSLVGSLSPSPVGGGGGQGPGCCGSAHLPLFPAVQLFLSLCRTSRTRPVTCGTTRRS